MKNTLCLQVAGCCLVAATPLYAQDLIENFVRPEPEVDPGWFVESRETRNARLEWFREAKFGMFVHWGVYSYLEGSYQGSPVDGYAEHILRIKKIPLQVYRDEVAANFNPLKFDANEWIRLAKDAGMRYFVITAKHHDGFAMWPSDVNDWDIADATPFERDPLAELRDACREYGLRFGFYYSQAWDWSHPGGQGNNWDFPGAPTTKRWHRMPEYQAHFARSEAYVREKSIPQLLELLNRYEPDLIWFDTPSYLPECQNQMILKALREAAPDVVVSGRIGSGMGDYESTTDQPHDLMRYYKWRDRHAPDAPWMQVSGQKNYDTTEAIPTTNLSYSYHAKDNTHKPVSHFLELIAKAAERGSNLLLNVGPKPDGTIDETDVAILKGIGGWMDGNGESFRGTTHTPLPIQTFGHVSAKGNRLYLHVTRWPTDGRIMLNGLRTAIRQAGLLAGDGNLLEVKQTSEAQWAIIGPRQAPDPINTVIVIDTRGEPIGIEDDTTVLLVDNIPEQRLHVYDAAMILGGIELGAGNPRENGVKHWRRENLEEGAVVWKVSVTEPLAFEVNMCYAAVDDTHGGSYTVSLGDQNLTAKVVTQERPDNIKTQKYPVFPLGVVTLAPGEHKITLRAKEITGEELFVANSLVLKRF